MPTKEDPSTEDPPSSFADHFKSPLFTVYLGPDKSPYHIHRDLLSKHCPYFRSLLSFHSSSGSDVVSSVHLDSSADTPQAFEMFVEFLYNSTYTPPKYFSDAWRAQVHAEVYVLAERLVMKDLKKIALEGIVKTIARCYGTRNTDRWDPARKIWVTESEPMIEVPCLVQLVGTVYSNTQDPDSSSTEEAGKGAGKDGSSKRVGKSAQKKGEEVQEKAGEETNIGGSMAKSQQETQPKDPMRQFLARFCASTHNILKNDKEFRVLFHAHPHFAVDMIEELQERSARVGEREFETLDTKIGM